MKKLVLVIALLAQLPVHAKNFSRELKPIYPLEFYAVQSDKYFDTLDTYAPRDSKPTYSSHVIRWEWYPWLYLTGYRRGLMKLDRILTWYPTKVINRDCRGFSEQPFGRCRVTFHYLKSGYKVDIYEEFTFNDFGEITFIEAWTDEPGLLPMAISDYWAEGENVHRLSTKVPGLGTPRGKFSRKDLRKLAKHDKDLKNLLWRLRFPLIHWTYEAIRYLIKH